MGQAAAALMGLAANRAKQVAEELLGSRDKARQDARHRAESLVDEGRKAAADVVSALRREATVLLRDLEHLEEGLRGDRPGGGSAQNVPAGATPHEAPRRAPRSAKASAPRKTAVSEKAAATEKAAVTEKPAVTQRTAAPDKARGGKKAAGAKKAGAPPKAAARTAADRTAGKPHGGRA